MPGGWTPPAPPRFPGGMPGGMPGGDSGTPAETGPVERGYLITLQLTSPNRNAPALVDAALVRDLMPRVSLQNALKQGKNYYIARAMVVSALPIANDETRKAKLRADYEQKRAAQEAALQNPNGAAGAYEGAGAYRGGRTGYPGRTGSMIGRDPGRSRIQRPGGGEDLTALTEADKEAFTDPLYPGEMVLDDWQLTVLIAVELDPAAPPVDPNAATATPTADTGAPGATPAEPGQAAPAGQAAPGTPGEATPAGQPSPAAPTTPAAPATPTPAPTGDGASPAAQPSAAPSSAKDEPKPGAATGAPK